MYKTYNVCLEVSLSDNLKIYSPVGEHSKLKDAEEKISDMLSYIENQDKVFAIIPIYKKLKCDA